MTWVSSRWRKTRQQAVARFVSITTVLSLALVFDGAANGSWLSSNRTTIPECVASAGDISPKRASTPADDPAITCPNNGNSALGPGSAATDLTVNGTCTVSAGTYTYHNINIVSGGMLQFNDATITLYAENIVVENGGSLIAGSDSAPIGTDDGLVTIHLWGKPSDPGVTCQSANCGIPSPPLGTNTRMMNPTTCTMSDLPGVINDCFYDYDTLDPGDVTGAYFGHKVLAVSYGGTLQLFGKKGATYTGSALTGCQESDPSCTGTSWVRLNKNALPGDKQLQVDGAVDWQGGDNIVLTTTDYLPDHSEQLTICGPPSCDAPSVSGNVTTINLTTAVQYPHNGQIFDLSNTSYPGISRLGLNFSSADTRAAVGLLSRSIRIVSDGDTAGAAFAVNPGNPDNYFGGHTIVRQGFLQYQVQGVEFYQLGQGGSIMHYPVHFHMARQTLATHATQPSTFVKDSSVWDSMTRWIVIHATQGVRLARNVGYESIGHGYYLEDGTETGNQLYANLGVFARGAVANGPTTPNPLNPRMVPGILTSNDTICANQGHLFNPPVTKPPTPACPVGYDNFPYYSDSNHPSVFWIMNGVNDFEYNMASGAGTCGACYWFVPGAISGPSQMEKWYGYAGEQLGNVGAGTTPLQTFLGNSCSTAMEGFIEVGDSATCLGVNFIYPTKTESKNSTLLMLNSPTAPATTDTSYWPNVGGGGRQATRCSAVDQNPSDSTADCTVSSATICSPGNEANCDVVVLDAFTTAFTWAQTNFAAIWVRPFWSLVINSFISDIQNAGVNFVTSGGYDTASVPPGFWALARKNAFVGSTQWQNSNNNALSDNPLASNAGPFNPFVSKSGVKGSVCAPFINGAPNNAYCLSQSDGVSIQLAAFSDFQRFFSVYDGPTYQDSNAFINIHPTFLTSNGTASGAILNTAGGKCEPSDTNGNPCQFAGFASAGNQGLRAYRAPKPEDNRCYFPNSAIGWKQPNGFFYAPAFHSVNLFFSDVDIRHFVTDPFFTPGLKSFDTDVAATKKKYCFWDQGTFTGFTDIDRETVLNDDDGTLTGLSSPSTPAPTPTAATPTATPTPSKGSTGGETISVNEEAFFDAPTEAWECASDYPANKLGDSKCLPVTAKTSPFEYVSTAIYPECAKTAPPIPLSGLSLCTDGNWGSSCTNSPPSANGCLGVPIYRQLLKSGEVEDPNIQLKRMMGQNTFQRSALTVNHGVYYIDTTVTKDLASFPSPSVFAGGNVYDIFFLFTKPDTRQTYQLYVGKKIPGSGDKRFDKTNVKFGYENRTLPFTFTAGPNSGALPKGWNTNYDPATGILTLETDMSGIANDYNLNSNLVQNGVPTGTTLGKELCEPPTTCTWNAQNYRCQCNPNSPHADLCNQVNPAGQTICDWSVKDLDCPAQGCPAFQITFPSKDHFVADDSDQRPTPDAFGKYLADQFDWNVDFELQNSDIAGQQCFYTKQPATTMACPAVKP